MVSSIRFNARRTRPPSHQSSSSSSTHIVLNGTPVQIVHRAPPHRKPPTTYPTSTSTASSSSTDDSSVRSSNFFSCSSSITSSIPAPSLAPTSPKSTPTPTSPTSPTSHSSSGSNEMLDAPPNLTLPSLAHDIDDTSTASFSSSSSPSSPQQPPSTFFIHNGYRYDGELFELRPPQERSIASRPERILEHKPALLPNRQHFNRVYSEGTYNARPSSLRQPDPNNENASPHKQPPNLDLPDSKYNPLPVTRPPSVRPSHISYSQRKKPPSSDSVALARTIDELKKCAARDSESKLNASLANSNIPVQRISGHRPALYPSNFYENDFPLPPPPSCTESAYEPSEKRERSYTTFAANSPFASPERKARSKRPSFWKLLSSR